MENILFDFLEKYITLNQDEKNAITSLDIFHNVKKGTILLREGQRSREGYFVLKGCLRTYYIMDNDEKTTSFYTEMEGINPPGAVNNTPSDYYISCVEDSIIIISNPGMEAEIFEKFPKFETLCRLLTEDLLIKKQASFDEFKTSSPEQRYLSLVKNRPDLLQRVPQNQLASFLGITPQSLSRMRTRILENNK